MNDNQAIPNHQVIPNHQDVQVLNHQCALALGWTWQAFEGFTDHGRWKMPTGKTTIQLPDFCGDTTAFVHLVNWCASKKRFGFYLDNDRDEHITDTLWQAEVGYEGSSDRSYLGGGDLPGEALVNAILVFHAAKTKNQENIHAE